MASSKDNASNAINQSLRKLVVAYDSVKGHSCQVWLVIATAAISASLQWESLTFLNSVWEKLAVHRLSAKNSKTCWSQTIKAVQRPKARRAGHPRVARMCGTRHGLSNTTTPVDDFTKLFWRDGRSSIKGGMLGFGEPFAQPRAGNCRHWSFWSLITR
jgi:hypothetical protein